MFNDEALRAFALGMSAFETGLAIVLILFLVVFKLIRQVRTENREALLASWLPVMHRALANGEINYLPLKHSRKILLLDFWNRMFDSSRPQEREVLRQFADKNDLPALAASLLKSRSRGEKLLGLRSLGNIGDRAYYDQVLPFSRSEKDYLALTATRALLMMEPDRAAEGLLEKALERQWPRKIVAELVRLTEARLWQDSASRILQRGNPEDINSLLHFIEGIDLPGIRDDVYTYYRANDESQPSVLAVLRYLGSVGHPGDKPLFTSLIAHPDWVVQVRAIQSLGPLADDKSLLEPYLNDENWWVRYRAAKVLAELPVFDMEHALTTAESPLAQEALRLAIFEKVAQRAV